MVKHFLNVFREMTIMRAPQLYRCLWFGLLMFGAVKAEAQRKVFAHYMLTNQDYLADTGANEKAKIAAYQREIRQAQTLGIDGFALNAGGWLAEPHYIRYSAEMFEAALRLHSGFKLMFSADFCCKNSAVDAEDMMRRFAGNPRYASVYFTHKGKFVLTTFAGDKLGTSVWQQVRTDLATGAHPSTTTVKEAPEPINRPPSNNSIAIFLVPSFFWGGELPSATDIQKGFDQWKSVIDGSFYWGIAGVPASGGTLDQIPVNDAYASSVHAGQRLYMAPICLQFWGSNAGRYYEYSGGAGMRSMWMDAIHVSHPEWVEIITWNDFVEGTYISPIDDPNRYANAADVGGAGVPKGTLNFFHSHAGVADLMRYYIQWYKTGRQPVISQDAIYWFYRTQAAEFEAKVPAVTRKYGPVQDRIYVTAQLKQPGTLRVRLGGQTSTVELSAGSSDVSVPFLPGNTPEFELLRQGGVVLQGKGDEQDRSGAPVQQLLLLNRRHVRSTLLKPVLVRILQWVSLALAQLSCTSLAMCV